MTVPSQKSQITQNCNGVSTLFPVDFYFLSNDHLVVTLINTDETGDGQVLQLGSNYSVAGAGQEAGGSISTSALYPSGKSLWIQRIVPVTQETEYQRLDKFPAKTHERALDKLTMISQQAEYWLGLVPGNISRVLRLGSTDRDGAGSYRAGSNRIAGVGYPRSDTDAATYGSARDIAEQITSGAQGALGTFLQNGFGAVVRPFQPKMREIVSFPDFGGVVDNVTDSKDALARAASTGRPVLYGEGILYASTGAEPAERYGSGRVRVGSGPALPSTPTARLKFAPRQLSGMEPERLSATVVRFFRGVCSDSTGRDWIESNGNIDVDVNVSGLNGVDTGVIAAGEDYFPYVLKNSITGAVGIVLSKEISTSLVLKPDGFDLIRKLPWGFIYFAAGVTASAGIRPFAITGLVKTGTRYTDAASIDDWAVVKQGTANTFATFDVSGFVPDNARVVQLLVVTDHDGVGAAGGSFIRVTGAQGTGIECGFVAGPGGRSAVTVDTRVTSARTLTYHRSGGARTSIYVLGYTNIEPS